MLHFLAKTGKKSWVQGLVPIGGALLASGYITFHGYGKNFMRDALVARSDSGQNIELSTRIKDIIIETYKELEPSLWEDFLEKILNSKARRNPIRYFASSTSEPISIGSTVHTHGMLIGLPWFYNFESHQDIPDSVLKFKRLRILKKVELTKKDGEKARPLITDPKTPEGELRPPWENSVDRKDPLIKSYLDSLIYSDDAIRYVVAKELFYGDTLRPLMKAGVIFFSIGIPWSIGRIAIKFGKLENSHLSRRLPIYLITSITSILCYKFGSETIDQGCDGEANLKTLRLGERYRQGAVEYLSKSIQRNQAMCKLFPDAREIYDEDGNPRYSIWAPSRLKLQDKLAIVNDFKVDEPS